MIRHALVANNYLFTVFMATGLGFVGASIYIGVNLWGLLGLLSILGLIDFQPHQSPNYCFSEYHVVNSLHDSLSLGMILENKTMLMLIAMESTH